MLLQRHKVLLLPVQVSEFVYQNDLVKPFSIFLYLKMFAGDKVSDNDQVFDLVRNNLKMTDPKDRTFQKHFKKLLDLNWVGHNKKSGTYHIRSFDYIRAVNGYKKRRATKLFLKDILQMQLYLVGVLICTEIYNQKYFWEIVKGKSRTATNKRDVARQFKTSRQSSKPSYYGLCNKRIARLLGCKYTRACVLKQQAAKAGYLILHHHYEDIKVLSKPDYMLRPNYAEKHPAIAKKMRFWRQMKNGQKIIKVVRQLHDEIIPQICFKRVSAFTSLKVPFGIIQSFLSKQTNAKAA